MNFNFPYRVKLQPKNKLIGLLFKNYQCDIVIMSHAKIIRLRKVRMEELENFWVTGIECIKIPPFHKIAMIEEMA